MGKFEYKKLTASQRKKTLEELVAIFSSFNTKDEIRFFLQRLLSESEIVMLIRRLEIATLLIHGRTYAQIKKKLGVGISTIRNIDGWLTDAAHEYSLIREHNKDIERARLKQKSRKIKAKPLPLPGTLEYTITHDSRFIIFKVLLNLTK